MGRPRTRLFHRLYMCHFFVVLAIVRMSSMTSTTPSSVTMTSPRPSIMFSPRIVPPEEEYPGYQEEHEGEQYELEEQPDSKERPCEPVVHRPESGSALSGDIRQSGVVPLGPPEVSCHCHQSQQQQRDNQEPCETSPQHLMPPIIESSGQDSVCPASLIPLWQSNVEVLCRTAGGVVEVFGSTGGAKKIGDRSSRPPILQTSPFNDGAEASPTMPHWFVTNLGS